MAGTYKHTPKEAIALETDKLKSVAESKRRSWVRRWYDNNFFDDGFHFRYVSRSTGKIVDTNDQNSSTLPMRAIPKASRQIRGIANLLTSQNWIPVIYPEKVSSTQYESPEEFKAAQQLAKDVAKRSGHWLTEEFKQQDINSKIIQMMVLAAKHGVSYMQVWPDAVDEAIKTAVFDAFDIYLMGDLDSIYDSPFIIKATKELVDRIKANENFDEEQLQRLSPDNKYASDEVKAAYMTATHGAGQEEDQAATLILKESFIKEYISRDNQADIAAIAEKNGAMEGKKVGDVMIRHTFSAGGIWLSDEYLDLPEYPFVDFRFEPGAIYQTPLIERFIPANKSLDIAMSRVERWMNTMVAGTWMKRKNEDITIGNLPGGQTIEYTTVPPVQGVMQNLPPAVFDFISITERNIEEQGASTSALGQLPQGVKSGVAIESVKATEYANLKIASDMVKKTMQGVAERFLDLADKNFITPQTIYALEKGEPDYYDIIGNKGLEARRTVATTLGQEFDGGGLIPIKGDYKVDIQIENGMGYTMEGKKDTLQQIITFFTPLIERGLVGTDTVKELTRTLLELYQFGNTQDLLDAMDKGIQTSQLSDDQLQQIKIAVLETLKEAAIVGPEADQKLVDSTKVGVAEALKDTGMLDSQGQQQPVQDKGPSQSISFKDLPPEGKAQMAAKVGIQLDPAQLMEEEKAMEEQTNAA